MIEAEGSSGKLAVYNHYVQCCKEKDMQDHIISQTYFGKLVKRAFPNIRYNRKGPRGKALQHYTGLKRTQLVRADKKGCLELLKSEMKASSYEIPSLCSFISSRDLTFTISKDGMLSIAGSSLFDRSARWDSSPERSPESFVETIASPSPPPNLYPHPVSGHCYQTNNHLVRCRSCYSSPLSSSGSSLDDDDAGDSFNSLALYGPPSSGALLQHRLQRTSRGLPMLPSDIALTPTFVPIEHPVHSLNGWSNPYDEEQNNCQDNNLYGISQKEEEEPPRRGRGRRSSWAESFIHNQSTLSSFVELQQQQQQPNSTASLYASRNLPATSVAWCQAVLNV